MFLFWGPALTQFYNDAYRPSLGDGKHARAMGQAGKDYWGEIWPIIGPQIDGVMRDGTPTWHEDALVPIHRNGRIEEVFWTYGYSPACGDDGRIAGTLVVCTETTSGVLANRRNGLLARIAERSALSATLSDVVGDAFDCCDELGVVDMPFAAALDAETGAITHSFGLDAATSPIVERLAARSMFSKEPRMEPLAAPIAAGVWPEPVAEAFVVPYPNGLLVFGLSPRLPFDQAYRDLLLHVTEALLSARHRVKAVRKRLRIERERRSLLMQAPVAAALLEGPELVFQLANARYVEMVGREVVGKPYGEAFPEIADTEVLDVARDVYRTGVPFATDEMLVRVDRTGSGTLQDVYFKFNLEPIRDENSAVKGLMVIAIDITELVTSRHAQEAANQDRTGLVDRLEAANRAKDEFLAILGHELRNPLAPIVTALELIRGRDDSAFAREHAIIERQTRHLVRLVDDLLDVSRIVRGKVELKRETCELGEVLARAIEMAEILFENRGHELVVEIPEPIPWWGDPARVAQVVANLLTNAACFTPPGGRIELSARRRGDAITIAVTDNGNGIDQHMLEHVFETFVQERQQVDRGPGGLGLGLALSKSLVELHGGTVAARSQGLGHGCTFEVSLPVVPVPVGRGPRPRGAARRQRRILVVDDNVDAADLLQMILEAAGHSVQVAHDGPSALAAIERTMPEVAILDIGLPVMDGYELAGRIAALPHGDECRLIAVTGYGQAEDRERSSIAGFHEHLVKPVSLERLSAALERDPRGAGQRRARAKAATRAATRTAPQVPRM
jgi:signal transduction histidine kinase/CheY-like chemotaxis protein